MLLACVYGMLDVPSALHEPQTSGVTISLTSKYSIVHGRLKGLIQPLRSVDLKLAKKVYDIIFRQRCWEADIDAEHGALQKLEEIDERTARALCALLEDIESLLDEVKHAAFAEPSKLYE